MALPLNTICDVNVGVIVVAVCDFSTVTVFISDFNTVFVAVCDFVVVIAVVDVLIAVFVLKVFGNNDAAYVDSLKVGYWTDHNLLLSIDCCL